MSRTVLTLLITLIVCTFQLTADNTSSIKVDQAGYMPGRPKIAMVVSQNTTASPFWVRNSDTQEKSFEGRLSAAVHDKDSGEDVRTADFSGVNKPGRYYVEIPGVGRSWDFTIAGDAFEHVYYLAMRGFYVQRCGTAVDLGPEFPGYKHGVCHTVGAYHESTGKQGNHVSHAGWHDAGDYGRYTVNSGITTGTLLWAYELFGNRIGKTNLHLPESGNGTPDILNEIRWNLDWMSTMQEPDGGVYHKQTSAHFSGFVMPEKDTLTSYVIGTGTEPFKSSCATADYAAVMAIASRVYKPFDAEFSAKALHSAEQAWGWVQAHPNVTFRNPPGISTGDYGDNHCGDEELWTSAELWRTTHQKTYSGYFLQNYQQYLTTISATNPPSWSMLAPMALWSYALGNGSDSSAVNEIKQRSVSAANGIVARSSTDPYRISLQASDYIWGSNAVAMNYSLQLIIANQFKPNRQYVDAAFDNLHYVLGRNTFSLSWVTRVGEHAFLHPHHRLSGADGLDLPWPGLMSGGPNPGRQDAVMKRLMPADTPPAKAYVDEMGAYACNEIAINWNAPLVFVLAGLLAAN